MVLLITGALMLALGLFSAGVLVASPLGLAPGSDSLTLWLLFPLFSIVGYALVVVGARATALRGLSQAVSALLLLLSMASAAGLVLAAAGIAHPVGSTLSLWYVLVVAGALGAIGAASSKS